MTRRYNEAVAASNRRRTKHGATVNARSGKTDNLYKLWVSVKDRCLNPKHKAYHRYGGRGITIAPEWVNDFAAFRAAVGVRPKGATLDRIDNNKGYEPNNVRWTTRKVQANNRETNVVLTHNGMTMTLSQWANHLGCKYGLVASRWKRGLNTEEVLAPPQYVRGRLVTFEGRTMTMPEWSKELGVPYSTLVWRLKHKGHL